MSFLASLVAFSFLVLPRAEDPAAGDWAGWAYVHGGYDFPIRLHVSSGKDGAPPTVTFDSPAEKRYEVATTAVSSAKGKLSFVRETPNGEKWRYEATIDGDVARGEAVLDAETGAKFELVRSALPLPTVPLHHFNDCDGAYRATDGRTLIVTRWPWGELKIADLDDGAERTLFAQDDETFFAGPAQYVPAPIAWRISFVRNDDDDVTSLVREKDGARTEYRKSAERREEIVFESGGAKLEGTLVLPAGDGPFPAIVVLGGSDWTTRETVSRDAGRFTALGVATFRYDQRGYGGSAGSGGSRVDRICSYEQTAADARAAVLALAQREDVDAGRIGLSGRSRGGWFAPLAASACDEAAFLVLFVPPAISPASQERTRRLNALRAEGANDADLALAGEYLDALFARTSSDAAWSRFETLRAGIADRRIAGGSWLDILFGNEARDSDDCRWEALNMGYDPLPALANTHCPVLAIFGEKDDNVVPADNAPLMRAALERAGNQDVTIVIAKDGNHGLNPSGAAPVALHRYTGSCPEVWTTVRAWLGERRFVR